MLTPGTRIGPYEITAPIGAGGMGEVYRATDTTLSRQVAIKVLPDAVGNDPDRLARFEREARTLAALNHPNIAQIYGLERREHLEGREAVTALVLELIEGPTLADRLAQGATSVDEALTIAKQIAEALEAAHEQGIVHRDLKPANIKLRTDGTVKVLDFGLATVAQGPHAQLDATQSPTLTLAATRDGLILGTAAYMSPEQAAGKAVDRRADIWSFGVVVWEMLTGRRLFDGETVSHTLADVLRSAINFSALPADTPPSIRVLLERCLDRDVKLRLRDIGEARVAIQRHLANPAAELASKNTFASPVRAIPYLSAGVAAIALILAATLAFVHFRERPAEIAQVRFQIMPPESTNFVSTGVLSPDSRRIAFDAPGPDGRPMLWVRSLDTLEARPLSGTEGVSPGPFWSPDSRFIGFGVNGFPGRLKKVPVDGGPPQTLCDFTGGYREGAWNADGVILFGASGTGVIRVSENGGETSPLTKVDATRAEIQHSGPIFLPDGRHFLYHRSAGASEQNGVFVGAIDTAPEQQGFTRLLMSDSDPVFVPIPSARNGFLLFLREGSLLAQGFDSESRELKGEAKPLAENVGTIGSYGWFSASATGALAFRNGTGSAGSNELHWVDRQGKLLGRFGPALSGSSRGNLQLSPDGKRVALSRGETATFSSQLGAAQGSHVWIAELSRGIFSRLDSGEGTEGSPAISPDGQVAFSSTRGGAIGDLYRMSANGIGTPEPLLTKSPTVKHPNGFSPDGRFLIFDDHTAQRQDLLILPMDPAAGGERKPIPFLVTAADETFGQFSPDGRWIAYSSDESGRREVYVQGFAPDRVPAAAVGKWTISTAGGDKPRWSRDGKELYYIAPDRKMMAVPVKIGPTFEPGIAVPLFPVRVVGFSPYDVAPDGRFLLLTPSDAGLAAASPITVVLNWQAARKP